MSEKYAIENDFATQKEIAEREYSETDKLLGEISLLNSELAIAAKEASEFKKVLEEIKDMYLNYSSGTIIDGGAMGRKAYHVLVERMSKRTLWPYDEENKNG